MAMVANVIVVKDISFMTIVVKDILKYDMFYSTT
jgi:hypothetical protein